MLDKDTEVHIFLKGVVDFSKEVARLQKEAAGVASRLEKLQKKMQAADYATKCPAATQVRPVAPRLACPWPRLARLACSPPSWQAGWPAGRLAAAAAVTAAAAATAVTAAAAAAAARIPPLR